jgi:hypothetical protein
VKKVKTTDIKSTEVVPSTKLRLKVLADAIYAEITNLSSSTSTPGAKILQNKLGQAYYAVRSTIAKIDDVVVAEESNTLGSQ